MLRSILFIVAGRLPCVGGTRHRKVGPRSDVRLHPYITNKHKQQQHSRTSARRPSGRHCDWHCHTWLVVTDLFFPRNTRFLQHQEVPRPGARPRGLGDRHPVPGGLPAAVPTQRRFRVPFVQLRNRDANLPPESSHPQVCTGGSHPAPSWNRPGGTGSLLRWWDLGSCFWFIATSVFVLDIGVPKL